MLHNGLLLRWPYLGSFDRIGQFYGVAADTVMWIRSCESTEPRAFERSRGAADACA
jgi:hypothetical protein